MMKQEIWVLDANRHLYKIIRRKLKFEAVGNFCPAYVTYQGKEYLVESERGDLSDPFRANESYLDRLFIVVK